jgi:sugar lactone lactonase YvrE
MATSADAPFEPLANGFYLEGLVVEGDRIWYTDVIVGGVRRVGSDQVLLPDRTLIGGLLLNADGALLVAGAGGIAWADPASAATGTLVDGFAGTNEMYPDGRGGIVFGTIDLPAVMRGERPGPSSICRLAPDRAASELATGLVFANGLALAADGATLFFNESFAASRAFPFTGAGTLGEPRLLADKPDCDGMALDVEGNIWITGFASDHLLCVRPDGTEVRRLALPGKAATSLRFGGADMRDLFVNVVDTDTAQALATGAPITEKTSFLYRTRSPVAGAPIDTPRFDLG